MLYDSLALCKRLRLIDIVVGLLQCGNFYAHNFFDDLFDGVLIGNGKGFLGKSRSQHFTSRNKKLHQRAHLPLRFFIS